MTRSPAPGPSGRPDVDEARDPWGRRGTRAVYDNPWITLREDDVLDPSGRAGIYGVLSPRNLALGVLPLFDDGTTVLVGQYRYPLERYSWEIPEGGGDKAVDPLESIARELREEAGLVARSWHHLLTLHLSNSISDEVAHCWVAWDLTATAAEPEPTEELALWRLPFADAVTLVDDGTITDAMSVATMTQVDRLHRHGRLPAPITTILARGPHTAGDAHR